MLEKLKQLNYVSLRETTDLDKSQLLFVDYSLNEKNELEANVYTKTVSCANLEVDDINILPELVEKMFINRVNNNMKSENIINIDSKLLNKIDNLIELTIEKFTDTLSEENRKFQNTEKFVIKKENEIIFGYKTQIDQPGIILVTNEEGLKDNKNIRFAVTDIGFHPENAYFKIIIN